MEDGGAQLPQKLGLGQGQGLSLHQAGGPLLFVSSPPLKARGHILSEMSVQKIKFIGLQKRPAILKCKH